MCSAISLGGQLAQAHRAPSFRPRPCACTILVGTAQRRHRGAPSSPVRPGFLARMARLRFPEGRDGGVALGLACSTVQSRLLATRRTRRQRCSGIERDLALGLPEPARQQAAQTRQSMARWTGGRLAEASAYQIRLVLHGEHRIDQVLRSPSAASPHDRGAKPSQRHRRLRVLPGMGHFIPRELCAAGTCRRGTSDRGPGWVTQSAGRRPLAIR